MAEQAINTIYALVEKLDRPCGAIIRNLIKRAFWKKDTSTANLPNPSTVIRTEWMRMSPALNRSQKHARGHTR